MEEFESNTEHVEEHLHEHAHHTPEKWISGVALTAALLAALAASAGMMSGHFANDAMLEKMDAADKWNQFGVNSIKATVLESRMDEHQLMGHSVEAKDREKLAKYDSEKDLAREEAGKRDVKAVVNFKRHEVLARAVMFFQVAIAVSAISALTKRRAFWFVGIGLGVAASAFFVAAFLPMYLHP